MSEDTKQKSENVDIQRRKFLLKSTGLLGGAGMLLALTPFIASWFPNRKTQSTAQPIHVDLCALAPGQKMTVMWCGKPIWIVRRTPEMISQLSHHDNLLRDPDSLVQQQPPYAQNTSRSIRPDILVLVGLCTHLGCSPQDKPEVSEVSSDWPGGFYCPCHGSTFDLAGRVFKGVPAPINLEVPPYRFESEDVIVIGENEA